jgi:pSer/pThr/pTyr-binding forkhead associated (FHA) protein
VTPPARTENPCIRVGFHDRSLSSDLPAMPRVTLTVPDRNPQPYRFQLDRETVSLGRGSENDIVIECGSVSVRHAEMVRVLGGYELRDVGSTNGIKLGSERMPVIPLRQGTPVKLGDVTFEFELSGEEREVLARERPSEPSAIIKEPPVSPRPSVPGPPVRPQLASASAGGGFMMVLVFLVLAAAAFFAGLSIRHQKETGNSLFNAITNRGGSQAAPAAVETPEEPAGE